MSMNVSGFGTSNSSYTGMNTGNKGDRAAELPMKILLKPKGW